MTIFLAMLESLNVLKELFYPRSKYVETSGTSILIQ
jgi:hypothetical protein